MSLTRDEIVSLDKQYIWHPYTQMKEYVEETAPLVIDRAAGVYLYDMDGKRYIDGNSSWWVNILGHSNPRLIKALKEQIDILPHCALAGITHEKAALLGERLSSIAPSGLNKVFYSDDGSTAVEAALKMAFQYFHQNGKKDKKRFVTLKNSFYGETIGAVSLGGIELFHSIYTPLLFDTIFAPSPCCYRCPFGKDKDSCALECFDKMEDILKGMHEEIAAVIIEPMVQGAAGMLIYPAEYLKRLRQLTKELDILMIADEVFTGFGRTGKLFACEHAEISPDIMCLSKGLSGGIMPFAATLTTNEIYHGFYDEYFSNKTFYHGHSYCGNPLGAALALEVINIFEEENIIESLVPKISSFKTMLSDFTQLDIAGDVRSIGLIGAVEIVKDRGSKEGFPKELRVGKMIYEEGLRLGAYLRPLGDIIYMVPPLTITESELKRLVETAYQAVFVISEKLKV